jgi:biopolymer transport protein ExbB
MNAETGLLSLWTQGDWVTRAVALLLLAMSLASWVVILVKALGLRQATAQARALPAFWQAGAYPDGLARLGLDEPNHFRQLALAAQAAEEHLTTRVGNINVTTPEGNALRLAALDRNDWLTRCLRGSLDGATAQLQTGLAVLASVGSTAPFVGLFGTVWGIYHALMAIGAAGQSTIDKVAGPIGESLIMTALGLAVAIPAVLGYNALVRGNKHVLAQLNGFAYDLHALWLTGARVTPVQLPHKD